MGQIQNISNMIDLNRTQLSITLKLNDIKTPSKKKTERKKKITILTKIKLHIHTQSTRNMKTQSESKRMEKYLPCEHWKSKWLLLILSDKIILKARNSLDIKKILYSDMWLN